MRTLTQRLETSLVVTRGLAQAEASAAITRARRQARTVKIMGRLLEERRQHRDFVKSLAALGHVARATGFRNTVREIAKLAREHRCMAAIAGLQLAVLVEELRGARR